MALNSSQRGHKTRWGQAQSPAEHSESSCLLYLIDWLWFAADWCRLLIHWRTILIHWRCLLRRLSHIGIDKWSMAADYVR